MLPRGGTPLRVLESRRGDGTVGDTSCQVGIDMGTSMATPIVAGAAAVVRQYFVDGWYPNGSPVSQFGFNPSAPLVKAIMLGEQHRQKENVDIARA